METINASLRFSSLEIHAVDAVMKEARQNYDTSLTTFGARFMRMVDLRNTHTDTALRLTTVSTVSLFMDLLNDEWKFYVTRVRGFRNSNREATLDTLDVATGHNPAWPANGFPQARTPLAAVIHSPVADPVLLLPRPPTPADTGCNTKITHSAWQVKNAVVVRFRA